jgi:hypothetical protein
MQLPDPVMHRRRIAVDKRTRLVLIEDMLRMSREHDIEIFFHCSEHCRVEPVPEGYALDRQGRTLILSLPQVAGASVRVHSGSVVPMLGWISRQFDAKQPAPTIVWRARISDKCILRTRIEC